MTHWPITLVLLHLCLCLHFDDIPQRSSPSTLNGQWLSWSGLKPVKGKSRRMRERKSDSEPWVSHFSPCIVCFLYWTYLNWRMALSEALANSPRRNLVEKKINAISPPPFHFPNCLVSSLSSSKGKCLLPDFPLSPRPIWLCLAPNLLAGLIAPKPATFPLFPTNHKQQYCFYQWAVGS